MKKLKFAFKIFFAIIFERPHFATDMKTFNHADMTVNKAQSLINTLKQMIDDTIEPINLMKEVDSILSEPPKFN